MSNPERGFIEKTAEISKGIDVVAAIVGILIQSAPLVALSILGFLAGDVIQNKFKKIK